MTRNASENVFGDNSYEHQQLRRIERELGYGEPPHGWFWPIFLLAVLALSFFLPKDDEPEAQEEPQQDEEVQEDGE